MIHKLQFMIITMLGFAAASALFSQQQVVLAAKPSNPNCVAEEFSFFANDTPRGAVMMHLNLLMKSRVT